MLYLLITSDDVLKTIEKKFKQSRLSQKYTQEYVAENIEISIDLLRNIENGRNIMSYIKNISKEDKEFLKQIIIHIDKNY